MYVKINRTQIDMSTASDSLNQLSVFFFMHTHAQNNGMKRIHTQPM